MDEEQKKAALAEADQKIADATKAADAAKAELKTAQEANDASKVQAAEGKVKTAEEDVAAAQNAKSSIEAEDVTDLIDDANRPPNLKDGTPGDKDIKVPKDKFDDLNEKAKLFEQFSPLLAKLQKNPEIIDRLMATDDPSKTVQDRIKALEDRYTSETRKEIADTITAAVKTWPDFRSHWEQIKPMLAGLQAAGVPYREAVQRAYFAVNPEAVTQKNRLVERAKAREIENARGRMGPGGGGGGPIVGAEPEPEYQMTESDQEFARLAGIDPKLYGKHADWISRFADI